MAETGTPIAAVVSPDGSATIDASESIDANGSATFNITAGSTPGPVTVTFTSGTVSTAYTINIKATPSISGSDALTGTAGSFGGSRTANATLSDAYFGGTTPDMALKASVYDGTTTIEAEPFTTSDNSVGFVFAPANLNKLKAGGPYDIMATFAGNVNNEAFPAKKIGTLRIDPYISPKNQPAISGTNALSGPQGDVGAQVVEVELTNASFGSDLAFTCTIGGKAIEVMATDNGKLSFAFPAADLNALGEGSYKIEVSSEGNWANYPLAATQVGTLVVGAHLPTTWSLPKTFKATRGLTYQLVQAIPEGRALPQLTFKLGNKKAKIDANGMLTAVSTGNVKLTVTDATGATMKCKVTVVGNSFTRKKPLMLKGGDGLYTSTKRLYYEKGKLKAEVYVYNRTGKTISAASAFVFELREGNQLIYSKAIALWQFKSTLKNKCYKVYKLTITDAMLPGVSQKALDLGRKQIQAVIIGTDGGGNPCVPLTAGMANVIQAKGAEAMPSPQDDLPIDWAAPVELPGLPEEFIVPTEP